MTGAPVLIGYDGRADAAAAIAPAGALLGPRRAVVACVWEPFADLILHADVDRMTGTMREAAGEFDAEARNQATATAKEGVALADKAGFEAEPATARGKSKAWPTLLRLADEHDAAAIVVGSRQLSPLKGALIGSVAAGVLHHSRRPVLVVPDVEPPNGPAGPLVVAYDGSEHARRAIAEAGRLMPGRAAIVQTVWTSYAAVASAGRIGMPAALNAASVEAIDREIRERAQHTADEGTRLAAAAGLQPTAALVQANRNVCHMLLESARERNAAAIVAGSRGRSALAEILLGSVSAGLVQHSPIPVLITPAQD